MGKLLQYGLRQVFQNFTTKIIVVVFLFISVAWFAMLYLSYHTHIDTSIERELVRLECATKPLAQRLDPELHEHLYHSYSDSAALVTDLPASGFEELQEVMVQVKEELELRSDLYTMVWNKQADQLEFIVTTSEKIFFKHVWHEPHLENFEQYEEGAQFGPYTDENGIWLSSFQPIKLDGRTVAIVQADRRFDEFITEARAAFRSTLIIFLVLFILSTVILLKWINTILRHEERIRERMVLHAETIEAKNRTIMSSLQVADRIQQTVLPNLQTIREELPAFGVMYEPKDMVSGDFYWYEKVDSKLYLAAGDCTGHGIPGAMMSLMASSAMYYVLKRYDGHLSRMLTGLDTIARRYWHDKQDSYAGMDVALCCYDTEAGTLSYSSAMRPVLLVRGAEVLVGEADKGGIGSPWKVDFTERHVDVKPGDTVYMFSDGYIDQFGGPDGKRYMTSRFHDFLLQIQEHPLEEQIYLLRYEFHLWKEQEEQVDDVLVLGFKVPEAQVSRKAA